MASVIHQSTYFTSLPREYYLSQEIFDQEIERVFERQWIYVGHVSQVREAGDYYLARAATESLIITRDNDGRVRAFFNVCRHRGSQLCEPLTSGRTKQFVCPYHRWSFGLNGNLLGAPGSRDGVDFDYADWPLQEAHCEVFHGTIFVHLGEHPEQTLREYIGHDVNEDDIRRVEPERQKLALEKRYVIGANWKLMLENNCECSHCAGAHPSLAIACDYRRFFVDQGASSDHQARQDFFPLKPGLKTFSMDGEWVNRKRFGELPAEHYSTGYLLFPMYTLVGWFADYGCHLIINPIDKDTSELLAQWFVHEDAVEDVDYDLAKLIEVYDVTNAEDVALTEANQRGVESRRFVPGPNSASREALLELALGRYLELMEG